MSVKVASQDVRFSQSIRRSNESFNGQMKTRSLGPVPVFKYVNSYIVGISLSLLQVSASSFAIAYFLIDLKVNLLTLGLLVVIFCFLFLLFLPKAIRDKNKYKRLMEFYVQIPGGATLIKKNDRSRMYIFYLFFIPA